MVLRLERYTEQTQHWESAGRYIHAHYDEQTVVVYQAYNRAIGTHAVREGVFEGAEGFKVGRMTWIKPNFLWMMHRSGWASKPDQEMILAISLDRVGFDAILQKAVFSSYQPAIYESQDAWQRAFQKSAVRLQWDPDYTPSDARLERRAIQIGLGGKTARHYAQGGWIERIDDVTDLVHEQKQHAKSPYADFMMPRERIYPVTNPDTAFRLGLSS